MQFLSVVILGYHGWCLASTVIIFHSTVA